MGNSSSVQGSTLSVGNKIVYNHPKMKNLTIRVSEGREVLETRYAIRSKEEYEKWAQSLTHNPALASELAFNPIKHQYRNAGMCSTSGMVKIQFQNYPFILSSEIANRVEHNISKFDENQLWYLLHSISEVGKKFHEKGLKVGDIQSANIFMSDEGALSIATQFSWPDEKTNYQKTLMTKEPTLLAPEEIKELQIGKSSPSTNFELAESFSAGLTALDAILLEDSRSIYDKNMNFDFDRFNGKKENLKNQPSYGELLKHTILNLVEYEAKDRMTLSELNEWLEPSSQDIANLQAFRLTFIPQKLQKTAATHKIQKHGAQRNEQYRQSSYSFHSVSRSQGGLLANALIKNKPEENNKSRNIQQISIKSNSPINGSSDQHPHGNNEQMNGGQEIQPASHEEMQMPTEERDQNFVIIKNEERVPNNYHTISIPPPPRFVDPMPAAQQVYRTHGHSQKLNTQQNYRVSTRRVAPSIQGPNFIIRPESFEKNRQSSASKPVNFVTPVQSNLPIEAQYVPQNRPPSFVQPQVIKPISFRNERNDQQYLNINREPALEPLLAQQVRSRSISQNKPPLSPRYSITFNAIKSPTITKTIEIENGPTASYRVATNFQQVPVKQVKQSQFINHTSWQDKAQQRQFHSHEMEVGSQNRTDQNLHYELANSHEPKMKENGNRQSEGPRKNMLVLVQEKIRNSRKNFPSE